MPPTTTGCSGCASMVNSGAVAVGRSVSVATANLEQAQVALAREKIEATSFQNAFKVAEANLDESRVAL